MNCSLVRILSAATMMIITQVAHANDARVSEYDRVRAAVAHQFHVDPNEIYSGTFIEDITSAPTNQVAVEIAKGYQILGYGMLDPRAVYAQLQKRCYARVEDDRKDLGGLIESGLNGGKTDLSNATLECVTIAVMASRN